MTTRKGTRQRTAGRIDGRTPRATAASEADIFARMHQAVLDRRLEPGMKLKEVALAEAFGVNRAVVRRVLARLSYERLVVLRPNRAAVVASPSVQESRDIFAARRVVENPRSVSRGVSSIEVEGVPLAGDLSIGLVDDGKTHRVRVVLGSPAI